MFRDRRKDIYDFLRCPCPNVSGQEYVVNGKVTTSPVPRTVSGIVKDLRAAAERR